MRHRVLFIFYFIFCLSTPAVGAQIGGVNFADQITLGAHPLVINGVAMRTFTFFDVYAAALYLGAPGHDADTIIKADAPRVMIMHFKRAVGADKIADAWKEGLAANSPNAAAALQERFAKLAGMMEAMGEGEKLECQYEPGTGTTIRVKGAVKGVIEGKDFSDALLACWIGPKPGPGEKFKTGLLGK